MSRQEESLARALQVLRLLSARKDGAKFSELAVERGRMPAPTLSRLLRSMTALGLVVREAAHGRYRLGAEATSLARTLLDSQPHQLLVQPVIEALARATEQSAAYYEPDGAELVLLAKAEVPHSFHYIDIFGRVPELTRHGFGQVYLAWSGGQRRHLMRAGGWQPAAGPRQFEQRCRDALKVGYLIERGEHLAGVTRIAAPVLAQDGTLIGVLGISALGFATKEQTRLVDEVLRAARHAEGLLSLAKAHSVIA
jgi:DNA-binding IclR family transcriptional regulator